MNRKDEYEYDNQYDIKRHIQDREKIEWTSFGKKGDEPPKKTLIKDLGNIHLLRIKLHLEKRDEYLKANFYENIGLKNTLVLINNEIKFRKLDKILIEKL